MKKKNFVQNYVKLNLHYLCWGISLLLLGHLFRCWGTRFVVGAFFSLWWGLRFVVGALSTLEHFLNIFGAFVLLLGHYICWGIVFIFVGALVSLLGHYRCWGTCFSYVRQNCISIRMCILMNITLWFQNVLGQFFAHDNPNSSSTKKIIIISPQFLLFLQKSWSTKPKLLRWSDRPWRLKRNCCIDLWSVVTSTVRYWI